MTIKLQCHRWLLILLWILCLSFISSSRAPLPMPGQQVPEGMVLVKGGTFLVGSEEISSDEEPVHPVSLNNFYIGKSEVTQAEWTAIMGNNPSVFKGENLPVENVSWYQAVEFCNKKSREEGLIPCYSGSGDQVTCDFTADGYRLPTEAEWEYACQGGRESRHYEYSGSAHLDQLAWFELNSAYKTQPVKGKKPNELGIYDMSGNVAEWCWDRYDGAYYQKSPQKNPTGPASGENRLYRGGHVCDPGEWLRYWKRFSSPPLYKYFNLGLRVVRNDPGKPPALKNMVLVRGGTYNMGNSNGKNSEKMVHEITLSDFYIGKYEITQEDWRVVMGNSPSLRKGGKSPVHMVDWYDAVEYCNKRSQIEGLVPCYSGKGDQVVCDFQVNGYRLPTEAEWDYACRGGQESRHYRFSGSNQADQVAWYKENLTIYFQPVGLKSPNELGIYDMSGNMWEWCWDWFDADYYKVSPSQNPKGPSTGIRRVVHGGSWSEPEENLWCSARARLEPYQKSAFITFRVVKNVN